MQASDPARGIKKAPLQETKSGASRPMHGGLGGCASRTNTGRVRVRYGSVPVLCPWVIPRSICVQSRRHHEGARPPGWTAYRGLAQPDARRGLRGTAARCMLATRACVNSVRSRRRILMRLFNIPTLHILGHAAASGWLFVHDQTRAKIQAGQSSPGKG